PSSRRGGCGTRSSCSCAACDRHGHGRPGRASEQRAAPIDARAAEGGTMAARTGREFLAGLRTPREIWVGDEKVRDVVSHPAFAGGAESMARLFDLQHEAADVCLMPDPETGEPVHVSHMIPPSPDDLPRRHAAPQPAAEGP